MPSSYHVSPANLKRLKKIKLLALDIDGVLTDGRIFWHEGQGWTRLFSVRDGYGIRTLMKLGIDIAIISGGESLDVKKRIEFLKLNHIYLGNEDKLVALNDLMKKTGLKAEQIAYIGDELFDLPVIEAVGFGATVPEAVPAVQKRAHYVTKSPGGFGAARELVELIRQAQKLGPYLTRT